VNDASPLRLLSFGSAVILLVCFVLYDALLYSDLQRELRVQRRNAAAISASVLNMKISAGLRLGKDLRRFTGLDRLLFQIKTELPAGCGIRVSLPDGSVMASLGEATPGAPAPPVTLPITDRLGGTAGSTAIHMPEDGFAGEILPRICQVVLPQIVLTVAAALFFFLLDRKAGTFFARAGNRKKLLALGLGVTILFVGISLIPSARLYLEQYEQSSADTAARIGRILNEDLNKLLLVGVSLGATGDMSAYLRKMSANTRNNAIALHVLTPDGEIAGSSHPPDTPLEERFSFRQPLRGAAGSPGESETRPWNIRVSVTSAAWNAGLVALALNALTLLIVDLMVMLEAFLLLFHFASSAESGGCSGLRKSSPVRAIFFVFLLAKDLPVSFIPLRMLDFSGSGEMPPFVMGLPISAEILMAACGILLGGFTMKRHGPAASITAGMTLTMLGNALSMAASWPWLFILARGLAGAGYGLALLPAQAIAVREGRLAFLFAGVYAGYLCGGALGAIVAEHLGYSAVFGISALLTLAILPFPRLSLGGLPGARQKALPPDGEINGGRMRGLFASPAFLGLLAFSLLPASFLDIGLMNYFLPVFMHEAGASQSDIGRVFMLYCLVLICLGPGIEHIISRRKAERAAVFCGALACAAAVGGFLILPPLAASLSGAVCLGLAVCCNIPGQSGFLLRLPAARALGTELSMSVLNAAERVGQMAGPPCIGALFTALSVSGLALGGGLITGAAAFCFLVISRPCAPREEE
jgi:predicted MFS family arabinose efflux permease